jgi:hypothetical protein
MTSYTSPLPRICACCASVIEVERHHLYSVKDGCPDDLMIWLCRVCHERTHGMMTGGLHHQRLAREGIERAKAAGKFLGRKPTINAAEVRRLAMTHSPTLAAKHLGIARSSVYRLTRSV